MYVCVCVCISVYVRACMHLLKRNLKRTQRKDMTKMNDGVNMKEWNNLVTEQALFVKVILFSHDQT